MTNVNRRDLLGCVAGSLLLGPSTPASCSSTA
jgi:hypothetical protein